MILIKGDNSSLIRHNTKCYDLIKGKQLIITVFSLRAGSRRISPSIEVFFPAILLQTKIDRYFSGTSCTFLGIVFILVPYLIVCALARFSDLKRETSNTRSKSFPRFNPGEFSVLNMYNYLTPQNRT